MSRAQWIERQYLRLCREHGLPPPGPSPSSFSTLCESASRLTARTRSANQWGLDLLHYFVSPPAGTVDGAQPPSGKRETVVSFSSDICRETPRIVCCMCGRIPVRYGELDCGHMMCYRCLQRALEEGRSLGSGQSTGDTVAEDSLGLVLRCPRCSALSRDLRWTQETWNDLRRMVVHCRHGDFSLEDFVAHYMQAHRRAPRGQVSGHFSGQGEAAHADDLTLSAGDFSYTASGLDASISAFSGLENGPAVSAREDETGAAAGRSAAVAGDSSSLHPPPPSLPLQQPVPAPPTRRQRHGTLELASDSVGVEPSSQEPHLPSGHQLGQTDSRVGGRMADLPTHVPPEVQEYIRHLQACWKAERRESDAVLALHWVVFAWLLSLCSLLFAAGGLLRT